MFWFPRAVHMKEKVFQILLYNEKEKTFNKCSSNEVQKNCTALYRASACKPSRSITKKLPL